MRYANSIVTTQLSVNGTEIGSGIVDQSPPRKEKTTCFQSELAYSVTLTPCHCVRCQMSDVRCQMSDVVPPSLDRQEDQKTQASIA